jgi:choline kinase
MMKITGVILAGGKNSRIGTKKAFLSINGKPIIENIIIEVINKHLDSQIELVKKGEIGMARDRLSDGKVYMDAYEHVEIKISNEINKLNSQALNNIKASSFQAKLIMGIILLVINLMRLNPRPFVLKKVLID